jgi:antitoxin StbD
MGKMGEVKRAFYGKLVAWASAKRNLRDLIRVLLLALIRASEVIMANVILAETTASVSELKKNPMGTVAAGDGFPVAILNRNQPAFYCVPAKAYEALMDRLEDTELNAIADARSGQAEIKVELSEL